MMKMSASREVAQKVIEVLQQMAKKETHFTFPQVRRLSGIHASGTQNAHLWNFWRSLEEAGVVEELPTGRKRNRIFNVAHPERLNAFVPVDTAEDMDKLITQPGPNHSIEARLDWLEQQVIELRQQL